MKNVVIGLLIVVALIGGWWYFAGRPSQEMSAMSVMEHKNMAKMGNMDNNADKDVVQCPVMGTKFPAAKAYDSTVYKGKTYYFCCAGCPWKFEQNPGEYIKDHDR